jgi:hypothetical protein
LRRRSISASNVVDARARGHRDMAETTFSGRLAARALSARTDSNPDQFSQAYDFK